MNLRDEIATFKPAATALPWHLISYSPGYIPALEADYRVGSVVTTELVKNWDKYRDQVP